MVWSPLSEPLWVRYSSCLHPTLAPSQDRITPKRSFTGVEEDVALSVEHYSLKLDTLVGLIFLDAKHMPTLPTHMAIECGLNLIRGTSAL